MRSLALLALATFSTACERAPDRTSHGQTPGPTATLRHDWTGKGCDERPDRLAAAAARSDAQLAALFGPPTSVDRFAFGTSVGEFRVSLRNVLRLPADAAVIVTERTWSAGKCRLTVWSVPKNGAGVAIDSLIWSTDLQF